VFSDTLTKLFQPERNADERKTGSLCARSHLVLSRVHEPGPAADENAKAAGKKSLGGSGEMIQLELPGDSRTLSGIEVHGSRYGTGAPPEEKFLVYVLNEEMTKVTAVDMAP
jgi:hypothetical protein